jgi:hypothetical protein
MAFNEEGLNFLGYIPTAKVLYKNFWVAMSEVCLEDAAFSVVGDGVDVT